MSAENIDFQLTPAGIHRRNAAEWAIQTFKAHFIAIICSLHPKFPLNLWDRLLPQALITLNLMCPSKINPQLSAYHQVFGAFDYNRTPMAPPGIKIYVHARPELRKTFAPHATRAWYLGPALNHYRCHRVFIPSTNKERVAETVVWQPHHCKMPTPTKDELALALL